jgi:hypothetical protein
VIRDEIALVVFGVLSLRLERVSVGPSVYAVGLGREGLGNRVQLHRGVVSGHERLVVGIGGLLVNETMSACCKSSLLWSCLWEL